MSPLEPDKPLLRRRIGQWGETNLRLLLDLQEADFNSKGVTEEAPPFGQLRSLLDEIHQEDDCFTIKNLAINGYDLIELGMDPGPQIGQCMTFLLNLVQDEIIPNSKEELLTAAKDFYEK